MNERARKSNISVEVEARENDGVVVAVNARLFVDGRPFPHPEYDDGMDVLDVAVFFQSLWIPGRLPLFTCLCGNFGCAGCWTDIEHAPDAWIMRNCYDPTEDDPGKAERIDEWEVAVPWAQAWAAADALDRTLDDIRRRPHDERTIVGSHLRLDEIHLIRR